MHKQALFIMLALPIAALAATAVLGQDKGSVDPKPLPPLANPNDPKLGAKELFGRKTSPAPLATHSIGLYAKGCLAGAEALPINGETWQVMRLSRNRNWAHPDMVALLERLSVKAHEVAGWPGLLVGNMSQPRGGPIKPCLVARRCVAHYCPSFLVSLGPNGLHLVIHPSGADLSFPVRCRENCQQPSRAMA